jgi:hypothetical protein
MPELLKRIVAFKSGTPDVDDITAGFSLFLLTTGSPEAMTQARDHAVVYSLLHGGQVAPTLDQLMAIVAGAPQMSRTLIALERNYQGYSTLLDVLLGVNHRTLLHFQSFVQQFQRLKMEVEEQFEGEIHAVVLSLFQRHTQLTMARYFNDASVQGGNAVLPRIMDLIDIIKFRQWPQLPQLPPRYTLALGPGGLQSGTSTPAAGRSNVNTQGGGSGVTSGTGRATRTAGFNGEHAQNNTPNMVLAARFERTTKRLQDLTSGSTPTPRRDNGTEVLCLAWILRGECNTGCHRASSHRALTQTEQSCVGEFLTQSGVE